MAFYRTVLSSKGQLVIPSELRKQLGMRPGTGVSLEVDGDRIVLVPDSSMNWRSLRGCLKGKPSASEILQSERKKERDREER
jgi:AbrB family looped-hinge helix DNA binding protein